MVRNWASLSMLQYAQYIFPLITVPYLTRIIGVEKFGQIAFAQATIAYLCVLVNFGLEYSATRQIAIDRSNVLQLSAIYSRVIWTRIILAFISFVLMLGLVATAQFRDQYLLFLASYSIVLGFVFNLDWFFQGVEDMRFITLAGLASRAVGTALIFIVVRSASDYIYVPLLAGSGAAAGALLANVIAVKRFHVAIGRLDLEAVYWQLRDSWDNFLATAFTSLYMSSSVFILGILATPVQVGYYAGAEKIVGAIRSLWIPVPRVLYPHFARKFAQDKAGAKVQLRLVFIATAIVTLFLSCFGCFFAPIIVRFVLGSAFGPSAHIIEILIFSVFLVGLGNILGVQGLLSNGLNKKFRNVVMVSSIFNVVLLFVFVKLLGAIGPAVAVVLTQILVIILMGFSLLRRRLI